MALNFGAIGVYPPDGIADEHVLLAALTLDGGISDSFTQVTVGRTRAI